MDLRDELERAAAAAAEHGEIVAVLGAEPFQGGRAYLVALGGGEQVDWLVLDDGFGPVEERGRVREVASIVVLCELATEIAGGGQLEELRSQLATLRMTEHPDGIEDAESAALDLERVIGTPPTVASPDRLDEIGAATLRLERALGQLESPFSTALAGASATVEAFVAEVQGRYLRPLR